MLLFQAISLLKKQKEELSKDSANVAQKQAEVNSKIAEQARNDSVSKVTAARQDSILKAKVVFTNSEILNKNLGKIIYYELKQEGKPRIGKIGEIKREDGGKSIAAISHFGSFEVHDVGPSTDISYSAMQNPVPLEKGLRVFIKSQYGGTGGTFKRTNEGKQLIEESGGAGKFVIQCEGKIEDVTLKNSIVSITVSPKPETIRAYVTAVTESDGEAVPFKLEKPKDYGSIIFTSKDLVDLKVKK